METIFQSLTKAFGWSILNSIWQCALIYGLLFLAMFAFPKLSARKRHNLAYLSICIMFIWFIATFIAFFSQSAFFSSSNLKAEPDIASLYLINLPQSFSYKAEAWFPFIVAAYGLGILLQLLVIVKGYIYLQKLRVQSLTQVPESWKHLFKEVTTKLNIHRKTEFKLSSLVNAPLVIGYLKPVVLFPIALVAQLGTDQVEAILIHELSHIRRNDYLLNLIKTAIETVLFFNPFVWMAGRFIQIEREHACDDLVLKLTGMPLNYAHTLLQLELIQNKNTPAYALAASGKTQHLYQRIKRITNMKTNYLNAKQQMAALTLAVACLVSIAWVNPAKKEVVKIVKAVNTSKVQPVLPYLHTDIKESCFPAKQKTDTIKNKHRIKIVTVDSKGNKKEYNSVKELPDSLKKELSEDNGGFAWKDIIIHMDTPKIAALRKHFNSPEWKKQVEDIRIQTEGMKKKFDSPEWKKQMEEMKKNGEQISIEMKKKFDSPEWKKQMEDMKKNGEQIQIEIRKKFDSPEWKKQIEDMRIQAEDMKKKLNSPEWKKQMEEMKSLYSSPEYKELQKKFQQDIEALKKKQAEKDKKVTEKN